MAELKGVEYMRRKLAEKRRRVLLRYKYYDMKKEVPDFGIATPPQLQGVFKAIGWCGKAVDSLADRLVFSGFRNDAFNLYQIYQQNNPDVLSASAIQAALIGSCSFIYIYPDDDGFPKMETIDGANATGIVDPVTGLLKEGYAVLDRDEHDRPTLEAYFAPGAIYYLRGKEVLRVYQSSLPYVLLVPVIFRPDATRPFGHSRISRSCMSLMEGAVRTIRRADIASEFYSFPQKWATGLSEDAEKFDKWQASMASLLVFTKDEQGERPTLGQFTQQSMTPHIDQVKMFASLFAGETGLTLDDLGFVSGNPSSADAIRHQHEGLRLTARRAQRTFGTGLLNAGFVAACIRDDFPYTRRELYETTPIWEPIFEPDASTLAGFGDAALKIEQALPGYLTEDRMRDLFGI